MTDDGKRKDWEYWESVAAERGAGLVRPLTADEVMALMNAPLTRRQRIRLARERVIPYERLWLWLLYRISPRERRRVENYNAWLSGNGQEPS